MAHSKAEKLALLERRKNVAARYVRGQPQWEIAKAFEVDPATISRDLKAIQTEWLAQAVMDLNTVKAEQLAKIDATESEAWKAWTKSQDNAETLRARMRDGKGETEKVTKGQAGDPRFLDVVLKCVQRRCEILGLDAPKKNEHTGKDGKDLFPSVKVLSREQFNALTDEERLAYLRGQLVIDVRDIANGTDS